MKITLLILIILLTFSHLLFASEFPVEGNMRIRVDFWKKVYTEITTSEAFIHDSEDLTVIYKKVKLPSTRRKRIRFTRKVKRNLALTIRSISRKKYENLTQIEQEVANIIGKRDSKELSRMSRDLRFQYGLKDRYYKGLINSYRYMEYIKKMFKDLNMPERLAYLPHVESSFNYQAYSKVGAAGIWQFMRATARRYGLKVSYVVDERRDVIKATKAAARFLKDNYKSLKTWPLALTAYNHGPLSIKRAVKKLGTTKINEIVERYDGRRFGFASKNFYATYMATVEISEAPEKYFKSFKKPPKFTYSIVKLNRPYTINQIINNLKISKKTIKKYNPSIRRMAYKGAFRLPRKFHLHIPATEDSKIASYQKRLKNIKPPTKDFNMELMHIVSRGENLFDISRMYKKSMNDIIAFNQIMNPSKIYAGMKLKIPGKDSKLPTKKIVKVVKVTPHPIEIKEPTATATPPTIIKSFVGPRQDVNLESYELDIIKISKDLYTVTVETEETLGHLADWAKIPTQEIRNLNHYRKNSYIHVGQKVKISISEENFDLFKKERNEYHLSIQEDFYDTFKITGKIEYKVKTGDTLSSIIKRTGLPFWLLRQQNDNLTSYLFVGQKIIIPEIESKEKT